jgi:H+/Cl- antiporter ClcA
MSDRASDGSTTGGLPVAPSMGPALSAASVPLEARPVDRRVLFISALCIPLAILAGLVAQGLTRLIGLVTNLAYYHKVDTTFSSPANNHLGWWAVLVPVGGGIIVGLMARYGSRAIRGHGIPEAMEQVLTNESRVPARLTFLKPISAAIAIGTGGPFGAEGPIIATGGALGSLLGQILSTTANERKVLLAAGAAAGMAATFGSPVSAVLLAVELLLFEYRARSLIPVALAAAAATGTRIAFSGSDPVFAMPFVSAPGGGALAMYVGLGAAIGVASVLITRLVYAVEDGFEKLPIHWMWWPAIGALAVGVIGYFAPRTLGVGYDNIEQIVGGVIPLGTLAFLCTMKLISWAIALGSGTSGGTLAPLFTVGSGLGALGGAGLALMFPKLGLDPRVAALVGMAAMFAGASRALLASVVFAFETTRQPLGLLPLLGGCTAAYLVSSVMMRNTIMTEKIARRGIRVLADYAADFLDQVKVMDRMSRDVLALDAGDTVGDAREALIATRHQGFPILDGERLIGVLTRRDLEGSDASATLRSLVTRAPAVVYDDSSLRDAADQMTREEIGRLPVVKRSTPDRVVGFLTRSDLLTAHRRRLDETHQAKQHLPLPMPPGVRMLTSVIRRPLRRRGSDNR